MTYGEMITSIRIKIDDVHKTRFSNNEPLRLALNEAIQHIYREFVRHNIYTSVVETTVEFTSGNQEIEFATSERNNIQRLVHVRDAEFVPISIYAEEFSKRSSIRSVYLKRKITSIVGSENKKEERLSLGWYICPSSTFTVTVQYIPKIVEFTLDVVDSDFIEIIPKEHHDVVVLRAAVLLLGVDEDNSSFWFGIYRETMQSMIESVELLNEAIDEVVDVSDVPLIRTRL